MVAIALMNSRWSQDRVVILLTILHINVLVIICLQELFFVSTLVEEMYFEASNTDPGANVIQIVADG